MSASPHDLRARRLHPMPPGGYPMPTSSSTPGRAPVNQPYTHQRATAPEAPQICVLRAGYIPILPRPKTSHRRAFWPICATMPPTICRGLFLCGFCGVLGAPFCVAGIPAGLLWHMGGLVLCAGGVWRFRAGAVYWRLCVVCLLCRGGCALVRVGVPVVSSP